MKPIVIYLDKNEGKVVLSRKEFEEYISKAYQQGYDCGYAEGKKYYWWTPTYTYTNTTGTPPTLTTTTPKYNPNIEITCSNLETAEACINMSEAHNSIGD